MLKTEHATVIFPEVNNNPREREKKKIYRR